MRIEWFCVLACLVGAESAFAQPAPTFTPANTFQSYMPGGTVGVYPGAMPACNMMYPGMNACVPYPPMQARMPVPAWNARPYPGYRMNAPYPGNGMIYVPTARLFDGEMPAKNGAGAKKTSGKPSTVKTSVSAKPKESKSGIKQVSSDQAAADKGKSAESAPKAPAAAPGGAVVVSPPMLPPPGTSNNLYAALSGLEDSDPSYWKFYRPHKDCWWASLDYTASWLRPWRMTTPLVTTGLAADPSPGSLGQPGTAVLFGDTVKFDKLSGFRLEGGKFLDDDGCFSLDGGLFVIFPGHTRFFAASDRLGNPVIGRPVFDVVNQEEFTYRISLPASGAFPALSSGSVSIDADSALCSIDLNARWHCYTANRLHANCLAGLRFMRLAETLNIKDQLTPISEGLTFLGADIALNESLQDEDLFRTANFFTGFQVGSQLTWEGNWFDVSFFGKVGLGLTRQTVDIAGSSTLISPLGNQVALGGILAQPTNIGVRSQNVLGVVPELGLKVGCDLCSWARVNWGYSFLYWNSVVRAGEQIDRFVNPGQVPTDQLFNQVSGPARPAFSFNDAGLWVHTLSLGLEMHY